MTGTARRPLIQIFSKPGIQLVIVLLMSIAFSTFNYHINGVKVVSDSARYLEYATALKNGFFFDPHNFWYIGYALYIRIIQAFGGDLHSIVSGQYILAQASVVVLYMTALNIWKNPVSAFLTSMMYIFFIDLGKWASYVLTESLYTSFICLSLYFLSLLHVGRRSIALWAFTLIVILYTALIKPTGIALFGAVSLVLLIQLVKKLESSFWRRISIVLSIALFFILINRMLTTYLIIENYQKGEIIYAITTLPAKPEYQMMILTPPADLFVPDSKMPAIFQIIVFAFHHPLYWTKLFAAKLFFVVANIRPYWSWIHNTYSLLFLIPVYYFFVLSFKRNMPRSIGIFAIAYVVIHLLSVGITSDDWDGRFLIPMLPVLFLLSGEGIKMRLQQWRPGPNHENKE